MNGPNDPDPELVVEDGEGVRPDGRSRGEVDVPGDFLGRPRSTRRPANRAHVTTLKENPALLAADAAEAAARGFAEVETTVGVPRYAPLNAIGVLVGSPDGRPGVVLGHAQGSSVLSLEPRCLAAIRAAGSQGVQNGGISCVALALAVPGGS